MADIGSNSNGASQNEIKSFVERIERLNGEKADLSSDISEVYKEAKSRGFDTKALRKAVRIRAMDQAQRKEEEAVLELYLAALGLL
jgi:uncharacterized protein (UPF0335 family)